MRFFYRLILCVTVHCCLIVPNVSALDQQKEFTAWLKDFQAEAGAAGISQKTLSAAFTGVDGPLDRVIELDRNQPEFTQSLADYVKTRVSGKRLAEGRKMMKRYPTWLGKVEQQYGVPRQVIVALWGIETNYGAHSGSFPVIQALATLTYDGRRSAYFHKELLDALHILDAGHIRLSRMKGSWAGAMGQCQFMPSSFRHYAVDADGDGRINIWGSVPDVFASAANYLKQVGWKRDQPWGYAVNLAKDFDRNLAGMETRHLLSYWQEMGVRGAKGGDLPQDDMTVSLFIPEGQSDQGYLVTDNFRAILRWNNSKAFGVAVGTLSDLVSQK